MAITNTNLTSTPAVIVTGASAGTAITSIYLCNNTTETATVDIFLCQSGEGANDGNVGDSTTNANIVYKELSITAKDTYVIDTEKLILGSGDTLQAQQNDSSGSVIMTVSKLDL